MAQIEIFLDSTESRFYPVPGVHAARKLIQSTGKQAVVHDVFLSMPEELLEGYFSRLARQGERPEQVAIYCVMTFPPVDERERFERINQRLTLIRKWVPESTRVVVAGYFAPPADYLAQLTAADAIGKNGYDSLIAMCAGREHAGYTSLRKPTNFVTANGYAWQAAHLMIDEPTCLFACGNCPVRSDCQYKNMGEAWARVAPQVVSGFEADLAEVITAGVKNLCLVESARTISADKHRDVLSAIQRHPGAEYHLTYTLLNVLARSPDWASYLAEANFRCCNFSVYALEPVGISAMELVPADPLELAWRARKAMGPQAYLSASVLVGMPGDTLASIERRIAEYREVFDSVDPMVLGYMEGMPFLTEHRYRRIRLARGDSDIYSGWENDVLSSAELGDWLAEWTAKERLTNPAYAAYRSPTAALFAAEEGYASVQIKADIAWANELPDGVSRLMDKVARRDAARLQRYLAHYREAAPA